MKHSYYLVFGTDCALYQQRVEHLCFGIISFQSLLSLCHPTFPETRSVTLQCLTQVRAEQQALYAVGELLHWGCMTRSLPRPTILLLSNGSASLCSNVGHGQNNLRRRFTASSRSFAAANKFLEGCYIPLLGSQHNVDLKTPYTGFA